MVTDDAESEDVGALTEALEEEREERENFEAPGQPNRAQRRRRYSKHARWERPFPTPDQPLINKKKTPRQQGADRDESRWDRWHHTKKQKHTTLAVRRAKNKQRRATRQAQRR